MSHDSEPLSQLIFRALLLLMPPSQADAMNQP
jgi:hypothetical protein